MAVFVVFADVVGVTGSAGAASAGTTVYDIRALLYQPHPFADQPGTRWNPAVLAVPRPLPGALTPSTPGAARASAPRPVPVRHPGAETTVTARESGARTSGYKPNSLGGIVHEISFGILAHDIAVLSESNELGADVHFELRFVSPDFLDIIGSPYVHVGFDLNTGGDTSQVFAGLSYEWDFRDVYFAGFSLGGAVHNGETTGAAAGEKDLGCRVLFRASVNLGYRLDGHHSLGLIFDHLSNARLCDTNEALDNVGLRYSYRF
jgi:lipid A 3-O-deacylase